MNPADAHERLTQMLKTTPDEEVGVYLLLCMTVLANYAPEVVLFVMDRADEQLAAAGDLIADVNSADTTGGEDRG